MFSDPDSPEPETRPDSNPSSPHFTAASNPGTAQPIEAAAFESCPPDFTSLDELTHDLGSLHELSTRGWVKETRILWGRNKALVHVVAKDYAAAVREYEE